MRSLVVVLALAFLPAPAVAHPPVFAAVLAEKATGFTSLAECERAIARKPTLTPQQRRARLRSTRGALFNRLAGNTTRCELVNGEPLTVVVPRGL